MPLARRLELEAEWIVAVEDARGDPRECSDGGHGPVGNGAAVAVPVERGGDLGEALVAKGDDVGGEEEAVGLAFEIAVRVVSAAGLEAGAGEGCG